MTNQTEHLQERGIAELADPASVDDTTQIQMIDAGENIVKQIVTNIESITGSGYLGAVVVFAALFFFAIVVYIAVAAFLNDQQLFRVSRTLRWFMVMAAVLTVISGVLSIAAVTIPPVNPVVVVTLSPYPLEGYDEERYGEISVRHPDLDPIPLTNYVKLPVKNPDRNRYDINFERITKKIDELLAAIDELEAKQGSLTEPKGIPDEILRAESGADF
jgi:hypothetical protein